MMKTLITIVLAAMLSAGCVQNMGALKDKVGADDDGGDTVQPASTDDTQETPEVAANATPKKAPVARMSLFGGNGALVFKSTFQADDPAEVVFVDEKTQLSAIAGESETLEKGATITGYAWTLNGKALEGASKATVEIGEAGLYTLVLTITDSNGEKDAQTVKLGVAPKPYDIVTELVTGPVAGAEGVGQNGEASFDLALDTSKGDAAIQSVTFTASPPATCDAILEVLDPNGESLGSVDDGSTGGAEEITGGALPVGAYAIVVSPFACVAPEGVAVTVTVTYLPVVPGLEGEHGGHGGHAGH